MKLNLALTLIALVVLPGLAEAQPRFYFRRPEPKEPKSRISFSGQVLFGVSANLHNLGNVGYPSSPGAGDDVLFFNDGYIIPSADGGETTGFAFLMDNARSDADGYVTSFDLSRYRSESLGTGAEADMGTAYGWEVAYDYQWGKRGDRFRLGVRSGVSVNSLDFSSDTTVEGRYIVQRGTFELPGGAITHEPGQRYEGSTSGGGPAIDPAVDLVESEVGEWDWNGGDPVFVPVPSRVQSVFSIDGIMVNWRLGPTLTLRLWSRMDAELSAGVLGVYYNGDVMMRKNLLNLPVGESFFGSNPTTTFERGSEDDFLYGYYGEGLLRYRATDRVSFYSSVVYMSLNDPEPTALQGSEYQLSFESPMMATAGLSVQF